MFYFIDLQHFQCETNYAPLQSLQNKTYAKEKITDGKDYLKFQYGSDTTAVI